MPVRSQRVAAGCRFPQDRTAGKGGGRREVAADSGEIEGRDGKDESFECAILHAIPDAFRGSWLILH